MPEEDINIRQLAWWNRQPTLWSHSVPTMELIPRDDDEITFGTPPLSIEPLNMDFDGDTSAIYLNHDIDALKQMYDHAFIQNTVFYDAKDDCLSTIRHEALYAAYILTYEFEEFRGKLFKNIDDLQKLPEDLDLFNDSLNAAVSVNGAKYTYGVCLFNKWCGFNDVIINQVITKKQIQLVSKAIYEDCGQNSKKYYDRLFELERTLMTFITITKYIPSLSLYEMVSLVSDENHELIGKIPSGNAYLSYHINDALTDRCIDSFPHESSLYKLFKSGSRFSKVQLARSCINIGLLADENNVVDSLPINSNLILGLTPEQFFQSAPGTRKGLIDKDRSVPESGYLERTLAMSLSPIEFAEEDCGCDSGLYIVPFSKQHISCLSGKYWKKTIDEDWKLMKGDEYDLIDNRIIIRSPMTCKTSNFKICHKCFGHRHTRTKFIGVTAGQVITERLTQLLMRSFHTSGSCELDLDKIVCKFFKDCLEDINDDGHLISLKFSTDDIPDEIRNIKGYLSTEGNIVKFTKLSEPVVNNDVLASVVRVKELMRKDDKVEMTPSDYYKDLMSCILEVGNLYSSFVELVLAHMFMVSPTEFWRYNQDKTVTLKLSEKTVAAKVSNLLGFLYQPNRISVNELNPSDIDEFNPEDTSRLCFHEKIFLNQL